jgi:hypothetical protein
MIKSNSFTSSLSIAAALADINKTLVVGPNTVLNELVNLSTPIDHSLSQIEDNEAYAGALEAYTTGSLENPTQHDLQLNGVIKDLSKAVTNHISFAKNTVKPVVMQFSDNIKNYLANNAIKDPASKFNIITLNTPSVLEDESFLDSVKQYIGKFPIKPDISFSLPLKNQEELLSMLMYGYPDIDKSLVEWVSQLDSLFLTRVWNSFFTTLGTNNDTITYPDIDRKNLFEKTNIVLAIYLFSRKLFDVVDESASNLTTYKNTAAQHRDYAGAMLAGCIKNIALFNRSNILVVETDPVKYEAKVNGTVYREWLTSGGSPEIILGLIVSGDKLTSVDMISNKKESYLKQWNSFHTFYSSSEFNKRLEYFKTFLYSNFNILLKEVSSEELAYIERNPRYYDIVNQLLSDQIENMKTSDMDDLFKTALVLIAKVRFYYTSAYDILDDIATASRVNPNIDVREAALLAVINYLSDYLANQISISK